MPATSQVKLGQYRRYYRAIEEMAQQPKTRGYTAAIFSFLAVSLFGWYAIRPTIQTILLLRREIADDKLVSRQMEEKITKLIEVQAVYQAVQNQLPLLSQALPQDPDAVNALSQLRNLASVSHASVSAISVAAVPLTGSLPEPSAIGETKKPSGTIPPTSQGIVDIPITLVATGTYPDIRTFLEGVVGMRRIMTIDSISLVPDKETQRLPGDIVLRLVLQLNAHYLIQ